MSIFINELTPFRIYKGNFYYPIDLSDRVNNSIVYLLTPNKQSTIKVINHPYASLNKNLFKSYYTERIVQFIIDNKFSEDGSIILDNDSYNSTLLSEDYMYMSQKEPVGIYNEGISINNELLKENFYYNDFVDKLLDEDTETTKYGTYNYSSIFRNLLYNKRMRDQSQLFKLFDEIKNNCPSIKYTYTTPKMYLGKNIYYDWSYYSEIFFKSDMIKTLYKADKGLDVFFAFTNRFLFDSRFNSYKERTIVIPVDDWKRTVDRSTNILDFRETINPLSFIFRQIRNNPHRLDIWSKYNILLLGDKGYFTLRFQDINVASLNKLANYINNITTGDYSNAEVINYDSKQAIMNQLADKLLQGGIQVNNLTGGTKKFSKKELKDMGLLDAPELTSDPEIKKAALVNKLDKVASKSSTTDDALESLNNNDNGEDEEKMKEILMDLQDDNGIKMNKARKSRMEQTRKDFDKKIINGKSVKQLLDEFKSDDDIPPASLPVDSINDSWKKIKFANFNKEYTKQMDADIVAMFEHFNKVTHPMNILDLTVENTSTSEDYINTWECKYEDAESGKRFTMKLDMPRMINNRFMKLRGNEKTLIGQLMLLPVVKTDDDTVQIVSNYNKIFIRRKSPGGFSKTSPIVNKLVKAINKYKGRSFKVKEGDNSKICSKYELPIEFVDLSHLYSTITFKDGSYISFNLDELSKIPIDNSVFPEKSPERKADPKDLANKYLAIYVKNGKREPIIDTPVDKYILEKIMEHDDSGNFDSLYATTAVAKRLMFSEASILNTKIPIIIVCSYNIGLQKLLNRVGIEYEFSEKRPSKNKNFIRFSDGYLAYTTKSSAENLLMNGLMQCDTTPYSIKQIDSKDMWLDILDDFGGRIKADGLDNFYDLMLDPITVEICNTLKIPSNYIDILIYANDLLTDNKFNRHSDITGNRLRVNEVIIGHLYQVLSKAYGDYRNMVKRNKGQASFSAKRSAVIDSILTHDQTSSDVSTLTPLLESETATKVTFKGLSGMNSDRAFSIDKRAYDDSMLGVLGISTGFASTVGINRQTTIDAGVKNKRGFITPRKPKDLNTVNTFSMMEALSPLAINHDDPFRTAMAYTQTGQHQMVVKHSMPQLITTGADEALPYLTSNKFSYKFPWQSGRVVDITDQYIVIQDDKTKKKDFIDLRTTIQKNSDGGFFVTTKLSPNVKKGQKLKYNDIVAFDRASYSAPIGSNGDTSKNICYNMGTLAKIAIMNTDLGFEDSCVVDSSISDALESIIAVQKDVDLEANSNVYNMVEVGDPVEEGDPLLIYQDAFDEKEANELLKAVTDDNKEELSDLGRKQVRAKVTGIIRDIKIYRTIDTEDMSDSLQKIVKKYDSKINKLKKVMRDNGIDKEYTLEPTYKLPQEGKLKNLEGVRIEFYIEVHDKFGIGDKLVFSQALKGVNSYIIPKGLEAHSEYRPEENINAFLTISGVMGRMVPSAQLQGYMNKLIIELTRQCQEELGIKPRMFQDILKTGIK